MHTNSNPTLRVALVGPGMIGRAHARAFRTLEAILKPGRLRVELSVVADTDVGLAHDAQARWSIGRVVSSWREVAEADDVDIACVGLPNHEHRSAVEALVAVGKHVLCEKPLAPTVADARLMLEAAQRAGVVHGVGFNLRRAPAIAAIKQAVAGGAIGELRQVSARFLSDYATNPNVPFTWRYQRSLAGSGALCDVRSHVIDLARYLVGELVEVSGARLATFIHERPVPAVHVTGHCVTATSSSLRASTRSGSNACVRRHSPHRPRRIQMRSVSNGARSQRQYPPQRISYTRQLGHRCAGTSTDLPAAAWLDDDSEQGQMMTTRALAPPFRPSSSWPDWEGRFFS